MKKLIVVLVLAMCIGIILLKDTKKQQKVEDTIQENIIEEILKYDIDVDESFLNWIENNYGNTKLEEIKKSLENSTYSKELWHKITGNSLLVLKNLYNGLDSDTKVIDGNKDISTISFVGDISLADNFEIMPYYDSRGGITGILDQPVIEYMNNTDLMVANSEFTISDRGTPMPNKIYTFRASPSRVSIYNEMGVDLVTLANNHVYDFGTDAFLDMLDTLDEYNMPHIGAGRNISEAIKPYYFIINGYKVGFINATRAEKYILTPEAGIDTPGVFRCYDPNMFIENISKTKENSDYVVALIHWGKEDSHELENVQIDTGKLYIDAGADIIIGSHAHVLQGVEFYNNKPIVYNLGDFIFNRETKETGIFNLNISYDGELSYSFIPCMQDNYKTSFLYDKEKTNTLNNMTKWSVNAYFDEFGNIKEN